MSSHDDLEEMVADELEYRGWAVRTGLIYTDEKGRTMGDIDILAIKENYCIIAELKTTLTEKRYTFAVEQVSRAIHYNKELQVHRIFPFVIGFSDKYHRGWNAHWVHHVMDDYKSGEKNHD